MIFKMYSIFDENSVHANRIAPDATPGSAASHLGLCCLPMSHKRDARLKCVSHQEHIQLLLVCSGLLNCLFV